MASPSIAETDIDTFDEQTRDTLSSDIANKVYKLQEDKKNSDEILKDIRERKRNENNNVESNIDNNRETLPNIAIETLEDRCGDGKCSISDSKIIEVLMPKGSVLASCPNCNFGIPHNHVGNIDECPNCDSTKNFRKSKYDPDKAKKREDRKKNRGNR